jgi:hypothetical protein
MVQARPTLRCSATCDLKKKKKKKVGWKNKGLKGKT